MLSPETITRGSAESWHYWAGAKNLQGPVLFVHPATGEPDIPDHLNVSTPVGLASGSPGHLLRAPAARASGLPGPELPELGGRTWKGCSTQVAVAQKRATKMEPGYMETKAKTWVTPAVKF